LVSFDGHGNASVLKTQGDGVKINGAGTIVYELMGGSVNPCEGSVAPFEYPSGSVPAPSNFCPGGYDGQYNVNATDISDSGAVVGFYDACDNGGNLLGRRGFISSGGATTQIGSTTTQANAINGVNWVVGGYFTAANTSHAFVWIDGTLTDLNSLLPANCGWVLTSAQDVNDAGDIVGVGTVGGTVHGFLLTPQ
jgi:probable HAF family extracellular repeat protein